jgi:hypothetical protein
MTHDETVEALTNSIINQDKELKRVARLLKSINRRYTMDKSTDYKIKKKIKELSSGSYLLQKT